MKQNKVTVKNYRQQKFAIIVGGQGHGKSTFVKENIEALAKTGKPVLLMLPNDSEELFDEYEELDSLDDIHEFKTGILKYFTDDPSDFLKLIYDRKTGKGFWGGTIVIDDGRVFLTSRNEAFRRFIMRRRQGNQDVFFVCHGLSEVPPSSSTFVTDIVLFGMGDEFDRWTIDHKEKFRSIVNRINKICIEDPYYYEHYLIRDGNIFDPVAMKQVA